MKRTLFLGCLLLCLVWVGSSAPANAVDAAGKKKIVLIAGPPSHGPGEHEHNAGVLLLKKCLDQLPGIAATGHLNGWPKDPNAFDGADAILFDMDGGHSIFQGEHPSMIADQMKRGVGLVCLHLTVEVPKDKGGPEFLEWLGGYYESGYSINPDWTAEFRRLPDHPITRGVKSFSIYDEWYFNLRFRPEMKGITPILVATPSDEIREGKTAKPPGPRPHIMAAKGQEEVLAWARERTDGGRSFGFTGGHYHKNWSNDNFRKLVLNAVLWTAKIEVPANGVPSSLTEADLTANLDRKSAQKPSVMPPESLRQKMQRLQAGVQKWQEEGRDVSPVGEIMREFGPLVQEGKFKEAEAVIDRALGILEGKKTEKSAPAGVEVGKLAPDFEAQDIHGKTHRLRNYQGKIVVLEASNLDCPFCANHFRTGAMQELQAEMTSKGVIWLLVNSANPKSISYRDPAMARREFADQKIKATAWLDDNSGEVGKLYGMRTTPHMFLINKEGMLVYQGAIDDRPATEGDPRTARNYVREAIASVEAGQPVKVSQTKPYGCAVKY